MSAETAEQLRNWASNQKNPRGEFALLMASALEDPKQAGPWSLLDIRREFEARSGSSSLGRSRPFGLLVAVLRAVLLAGYLIPVLVTWLHLRSVVGEFAVFEAANSGSGGPSVNLLTFWAGGYGNAYTGTQLVATARTVFLIVLVLVVLQFTLSMVDDLAGKETGLPDELLLQTQIHFARTRAMTPQEVTEVVSAATKQLTVALENVSGVVGTATELVRTVGEASEQLGEASEKLEAVTLSLTGALKPLEDLGRSLEGTNVSVQESTRALDAARVAVVGVTGGFRAIEETGDRFREGLTSAGANFRSAVESVSHETSGLADRVKDAASAVSGAADQTTNVVRGIGEAGRLLSELSATVDSREPHLLVMQEIVKAIAKAAKSIEDIVGQMQSAVEMNYRVNEEIAVEVRRVLGEGGENR
jgi:hypothetical protein